MKYQGVVRDRLENFKSEKNQLRTFKYDTYREAHEAAEKLSKKYYSGHRAEIDVITLNR